ncbi:unannotated protein [freshwater metagenome]|uniref:Unannotated protein n=1 Tax=freshwater metagenome TaxID=449393 RepID=A0A6J7WB13_9ZZZZ|nr:hypothetical protein [Actinomycetota bacterium]MSX89993.1 hypothetical protein [Actinomycetota bacterium]MSZ63882.1 hypothetical protein [Actinomycetota bacterium]MTA58564.1 hypothetical protein [Actinomycetota bacterium]
MSHEKLAEYGTNLEAFLVQARKFNASNIQAPGADNEWSAAYVLHHVADAEMHFAIRYFNALTIEAPSIIPFEEDAYPSVLNYAGRDWSTSLSLIESVGKLVLVALTPITSEQWERVSIHPEAGNVSVSFLIGKACSHMAAHTEQLKALL